MPEIFKPKPKPRRYTDGKKDRQKVYNSPLWKGLRTAYVIKHPVCEVCSLEGHSTLTQEVHHLISFMTTKDPVEREKLAFDDTNLISVCRDCHFRFHQGDLKGCTTKTELINRLKELGTYIQNQLKDNDL